MTPTQRTVLLIASIFAWVLLTAVHFYSIQENVSVHGAPLEDVGSRVARKMVLALHEAGLAAGSGAVSRFLNLDSMLAQRLAQAPADQAGSVRCQFAVMLHSLGRRAEAAKLLRAVPAKDAAAPLAAALADAFADHGKLNRKRADPDAAAIHDGLDGWLRTYALEALHRRAGMTASAQAEAARLQRAAADAEHGLIAMGGVLTFDFLVGVVALVLLLARGREWDLRSTDATVEPSWDPVLGWCVAVAWPVFSLALGMLLHPWVSAPTRSPAVLLGLQLALYAAILFLIHRLARGRWREVGLHGRRLGTCVLLGALGSTVAFILVLVAALILSAVVHTGPSSNPVFQVLRNIHGSAQYAGMLALVAMVGPLFEEILFRGVVYQSLKKVMPIRAAIPLSAAVFALAHGDLNGFLPLFVLGCFLAWEFERTRSVATSFATHCLWNAQVFLATLYLLS